MCIAYKCSFLVVIVSLNFLQLNNVTNTCQNGGGGGHKIFANTISQRRLCYTDITGLLPQLAETKASEIK